MGKKISLNLQLLLSVGGAVLCSLAAGQNSATLADEFHPLLLNEDMSVLTRIYDRAGNLWKLGIVAASSSEFHIDANRDWKGLITDAVSMIDLQARHCTTLSMKSQLAKKGLSQKLFTTAYLRQMGR